MNKTRYSLRDPFEVENDLLGVWLLLSYILCGVILMIGTVMLITLAAERFGPEWMLWIPAIPFLIVWRYGVVRR